MTGNNSVHRNKSNQACVVVETSPLFMIQVNRFYKQSENSDHHFYDITITFQFKYIMHEKDMTFLFLKGLAL